MCAHLCMIRDKKMRVQTAMTAYRDIMRDSLLGMKE